MRGADERFNKAKAFEIEIFDELRKMRFRVALNGTEHTHPDFTAYIRASNDPTSLAVRFEPDGVICQGKSALTWYIEAKCSVNIEKLAYEQYMKQHEQGCVMVIICKSGNQKRWAFIENIEFVDSQKYVSRYPSPHPVIDGWICPRKSGAWESQKWSNPQASGTPYKVIDAQSLQAWDILKPVFKQQLKRTL